MEIASTSVFERVDIENVIDQSGRVAYIDECGSFGFDFDKPGVSKYYILCAIVVEVAKLRKLHAEFEKIKSANGLSNTELKSSGISKDSRRKKIMTELLGLDFSIALFITDKEKLYEDSPLTKYRPSFIKYLDNHLHNILYRAYPRLQIFQDEVGETEFQESFRKYVEAHRPERDLFNQYEFEFVNSKDSVLVQLADFVAGSISKSLTDEVSTDFLKILSGQITVTEFFPVNHEPYWGKLNPEDVMYDNKIYTLAMKSVQDFIEKYETNESEDRKMQVAVLQYLKMYVLQIDPVNYIFADELVRNLDGRVSFRVTRDILYRRVIAPLRDAGVILASCKKGYKIPISVNDVKTYMDQTLSVVVPMISRMGKCRSLVKQGTDGDLDLFNDPSLIRFKRYFDEPT